MSLMLRHQRTGKREPQQPEAKPKVISTVGGKVGDSQLLSLLTASLDEDVRLLKAINSIERKIAVKREELVPKYRPYVDRLIAGGLEHDLLGQYLVWLFDAGEIEQGVDLGIHCLASGIELPGRFSRDTATFLADAVMEWSAAEQEAGRSPSPYFNHLFDLLDGYDPAGPLDVPDPVRAKYYRLCGLIQADKGGDANLTRAVEALEIAEELGAKVKTKLAEVRKRLDGLAQAAQ